MRDLLLGFSAILISVGPCWCQLRGGQDYQATIKPIVDVLRSGKISGSLEYWGSCNDERNLPDFPSVTIVSSDSKPPIQVLREMFASNKMMRVTQDPDGTIRMVETDVPRDVLGVEIAHLSFEAENQRGNPMFFPGNALRYIISAPEVTTFMKDHDIGRPGLFIHEAVGGGGPRMRGELNNVNLSEALDHMLKTFSGLWVYENCLGNAKSKRVVVFAFYPI